MHYYICSGFSCNLLAVITNTCQRMNVLENLSLIYKALENVKGNSVYIPKCWNCYDVKNEPSDRRAGEIIVEEQMFYKTAVEKIIEREKKPVITSLDNAVIYSMLPRCFAAWDTTKLNCIEGGTLLRCIALLPLLERMNINVIYMLPVFEMGQEAKKGELSSPYQFEI